MWGDRALMLIGVRVDKKRNEFKQRRNEPKKVKKIMDGLYLGPKCRHMLYIIERVR
jgi:hypothetical protein